MNDLISIIVPVYNAEHYISECLNSLVLQTYANIEIILINDGSTDNSCEICKSYAIKDKRIVLVSQENKGVSEARNQGIILSKGEWVLFVDADDYLQQNACETALKFAKKNNADLCGFNLIEFSEKIKKEQNVFDNNKIFEKEDCVNLFQSILHRNVDKRIIPIEGMSEHSAMLALLGPYCKLIKKNAYQNIKFSDKMHYGEDVFFNLQIIYQSTKIVWLNDLLYFYRITPNSLMNSYKKDRYLQCILLDNKILEFLIEKNIFEGSIQNAFYYGCFHRIMRTFHYYVKKSSVIDFFEITGLLKKFIANSIYQQTLKQNLAFSKKSSRIQYWLLQTNKVMLLYWFVKINHWIRQLKF